MPLGNFKEDSNHLAMLLATVLEKDDFEYDVDTDKVEPRSSTEFLKRIEDNCGDIPDKDVMLEAVREYVPSTTDDFRSELCHEPCAKTGSHIQPITLLDEDSDSEDEDDEEDEIHHHEDINSLLVKSWEAKVFPIITSWDELCSTSG